MRDILRIGAYELAFSEGVPLAPRSTRPCARPARYAGRKARVRAGGLNAVLRRIADEGPRL